MKKTAKNLLRRLRRDQLGVSVVEFAIAAGLSLLVFTAVYEIFLAVNKMYKVNEAAVEQQANARGALNRISREVRAAYQIVDAKANYLQITAVTAAYSDVTPDMSSTVKTMTIAYSLATASAGLQLNRTVQQPAGSPVTGPLAYYLRNDNTASGGNPGVRDLFHYYDSVGVELARPVTTESLVRSIRIGIYTDVDTTRNPREIHESTTISVRSANLGN